MAFNGVEVSTVLFNISSKVTFPNKTWAAGLKEGRVGFYPTCLYE